MWGVVNNGGTAAAIKMAGFDIAGKTGTAQVVGLGKDTGANKDHSWFVSYAPAFKPEIATITLIENVGFGGKFAAPATRNLLNVYYKKTRGEDAPGSVPAVKTQIAKVTKPEAPPKKTNNLKKVG
jgi:penicillin-binding protein 2